MSEAYVTVKYDVGIRSDNVPFLLNVTDTVGAQRWESVGLNAEHFWVAYILAAVQPRYEVDGDPNTENAVEGITPAAGGSLIFQETIRDVAGSLGRNRTIEEQDTVVHEVGHLFNAPERVTGFFETPSVPSRYLPVSIVAIRSTPRPIGR
jgi:hypothetical protein